MVHWGFGWGEIDASWRIFRLSLAALQVWGYRRAFGVSCNAVAAGFRAERAVRLPGAELGLDGAVL